MRPQHITKMKNNLLQKQTAKDSNANSSHVG
jgi:hypothetical protein